MSRLSDLLKYGEEEDDQLFAVALALVIVWVNRILFLKLLEAQLLSYHKQDKASFKFLNICMYSQPKSNSNHFRLSLGSAGLA